MKKPYDFSRGKRGAVIKVPRGKSRITIRLDDGRPGTGSTVHDVHVGRWSGIGLGTVKPVP
jgi:hypothetical protein